MNKKCRLIEQGFEPGSCLTFYNGKKDLACRINCSSRFKYSIHYFSILSRI